MIWLKTGLAGKNRSDHIIIDTDTFRRWKLSRGRLFSWSLPRYHSIVWSAAQGRSKALSQAWRVGLAFRLKHIEHGTDRKWLEASANDKLVGTSKNKESWERRRLEPEKYRTDTRSSEECRGRCLILFPISRSHTWPAGINTGGRKKPATPRSPLLWLELPSFYLNWQQNEWEYREESGQKYRRGEKREI